MKPWTAPASYSVGEHREWRGVRLVCTREHYAGDAAEHPWDPADQWSAQKAATLWTPSGPEEVGRLASLMVAAQDEDERLYAVISEAVCP